MKKMTLAEAIKYVRENAEKLDFESSECFAVRGDNFIPKRKFRNSWNRPDGIKTTRLPGVCACYICENDPFGDYENATIPDVSNYGEYTFLLSGEKIDYGNDEQNGEIILANHKIIAQIIGLK